MAAETLVPAFQEAHHIAGAERVPSFPGDSEGAPGREDVDSLLPELCRQVLGGQPLPFPAGLPAFQFGTGKIAHMLLEGPDGL